MSKKKTGVSQKWGEFMPAKWQTFREKSKPLIQLFYDQKFSLFIEGTLSLFKFGDNTNNENQQYVAREFLPKLTLQSIGLHRLTLYTQLYEFAHDYTSSEMCCEILARLIFARKKMIDEKLEITSDLVKVVLLQDNDFSLPIVKNTTESSTQQPMYDFDESFLAHTHNNHHPMVDEYSLLDDVLDADDDYYRLVQNDTDTKNTNYVPSSDVEGRYLTWRHWIHGQVMKSPEFTNIPKPLFQFSYWYCSLRDVLSPKYFFKKWSSLFAISHTMGPFERQSDPNGHLYSNFQLGVKVLRAFFTEGIGDPFLSLFYMNSLLRKNSSCNRTKFPWTPNHFLDTFTDMDRFQCELLTQKITLSMQTAKKKEEEQEEKKTANKDDININNNNNMWNDIADDVAIDANRLHMTIVKNKALPSFTDLPLAWKNNVRWATDIAASHFISLMWPEFVAENAERLKEKEKEKNENVKEKECEKEKQKEPEKEKEKEKNQLSRDRENPIIDAYLQGLDQLAKQELIKSVGHLEHLESAPSKLNDDMENKDSHGYDDNTVNSNDILILPRIYWSHSLYGYASSTHIWLGPLDLSPSAPESEMNRLRVGRALFRSRKMLEWKIRTRIPPCFLKVDRVHGLKESWLQYICASTDLTTIPRLTIKNKSGNWSNVLDGKQLKWGESTMERGKGRDYEVVELQLARALLGVHECDRVMFLQGMPLVTKMTEMRTAASYSAIMRSIKQCKAQQQESDIDEVSSRLPVGSTVEQRFRAIVVQRRRTQMQRRIDAIENDIRGETEKNDDKKESTTDIKNEHIQMADTLAILCHAQFSKALYDQYKYYTCNNNFTSKYHLELKSFFESINQEKEIALKPMLQIFHHAMPNFLPVSVKSTYNLTSFD